MDAPHIGILRIASALSSIASKSSHLTRSHTKDDLRYLQGDVTESSVAVAELQTWLMGGDGPGLLVIDSAESAGCPSDGASVVKWYESHTNPFTSYGAAVLVIDHVPKSKIDRPKGAIGSQHKLARVDGAALAISGDTHGRNDLAARFSSGMRKTALAIFQVGNGKIAAVVEGFYSRNGILQYNIVPARLQRRGRRERQ